MCSCISDADAKLKGFTSKCDPNENPCGYQSSTATANIQGNRIPLYCYKTDITSITPQPICGVGCTCATNATAVEKGLAICGGKLTPCGYNENKQPQYCWKESSPICPQGCSCLQEADAKAKFGSGNYTRCDPNGQACGYDQSAASANGIPKYCFKPTVSVSGTPTPEGCRQGCSCLADEAAKEKGLTPCGGTRTSCGYDEKNQRPLYCFGEASTPSCVYDYQKNVCSGTCDQGYTCGLLASKKDATGKVVYAACGCTGQPTAPCSYDTQKNVCTGTCQTGAACAVVGKNVDEKTGATTPVCGCPQQSSCSYNYDKEACVGTCTVTGENCQLNTIYRDPATGKVTFAECHCKGGGDTTSNCACDAVTGSCTGTCASGQACTMTERTTDNAGKVVCKSCGCTDTCVLSANNECSGTCVTGAPCARTVTKDDSGQEKVSCGCGGTPAGTPVGVATRQPGFLESIGSFFNKLFGGK